MEFLPFNIFLLERSTVTIASFQRANNYFLFKNKFHFFFVVELLNVIRYLCFVLGKLMKLTAVFEFAKSFSWYFFVREDVIKNCNRVALSKKLSPNCLCLSLGRKNKDPSHSPFSSNHLVVFASNLRWYWERHEVENNWNPKWVVPISCYSWGLSDRHARILTR